MHELPTRRLAATTPALLLALALSACDGYDDGGGGWGYPPVQTQVLEVRLDPDTVAVGDTVLIHVVIEDSTDERSRFHWGINPGRALPVGGRTDGPQIRFIAPRTSDVPGRVVSTIIGVFIDNGSRDSVAVNYGVRVPILN